MAKLSFLKPMEKKALGVEVEQQGGRKVVRN
jgi:hypothetical protein